VRALLGVHVATRAALAGLAIGGLYPFRDAGAILGDVNLFARYAAALLAGTPPYTGVPLEYPPGALPAILLPGLSGGGPFAYRVGFVTLCLGLDAAVLAALLVLGGRGGDPRRARDGAWCWVAGVPLIGPLAVTRLDPLPALATVLAVQRAATGRHGQAGAWLGFGAAVKFYPGLLLPGAVLAARRTAGRRGAVLVAAGGAAAGLAALALAGPGLEAMLRTVVGYHLDRGLQIESLWATPLLVAGRLGADVPTAYTFRAHHVVGGAGAVAEQLATAGALAALAAGTWLTGRAARARPAAGLAEGLFASLLLLLAAGSVLSPQYLVWALALAAAALAAGTRVLRGPAWAVLLLCLLTQAVYPVLYDQVLGRTWPGLALLATRNLLLGGVAAWAAVALWRSTRPAARRPGWSARVGAAQQVALDQVVPAAHEARLDHVGGEGAV